MRRRIPLFGLCLCLCLCLTAAGVLAVVLSKREKPQPDSAPEAREAGPRPESPGEPVAGFTVPAADAKGLPAPWAWEPDPLEPVEVPTLQPTQRLGTFRLSGPTASSIAASRDGSVIAFIGVRGASGFHLNAWPLIVWDVAAGKAVRELSSFSGDGALGERFALSPDGRTLYTSRVRDHYSEPAAKLCVWDVASGKLLRERSVGLWALSADGGTLVTADLDPKGVKKHTGEPEPEPRRATLALWNAADFTQRAAFAYDYVPESLAVSPGGAKVVCVRGGVATGFDAATGRGLWESPLGFKERRGWDAQFAFSPDGSTIAVGVGRWESDPEPVRLIDTNTGEGRTPVVPDPQVSSDDRSLGGMSFTPDGKTLLVGLAGGVIPVDVAAGERAPLTAADLTLRDIRPAGFVLSPFTLSSFALSGDGKTAFFGRIYNNSDPCGLRVVDMATKAVKFPPLSPEQIAAPFPPVDPFPLAWRASGSPYPEWLTLADGRKFHWVGPLSSLRRVSADGAMEPLPMGDVHGYLFTPDGDTLITRGLIDGTRDHDQRIRFRDAATAKPWADVPGEIDWPVRQRAMTLSADGRTLAAPGPNGCLWLWEVATAKPRLRLAPERRYGLHKDLFRFTFSRDGRHLMAHDEYALTGLVWDLAGEPNPIAPDAVELGKLWDALRGDDAGAAYRAIGRLGAHPATAVPFLRAKAKDVPDVTDAKRLAARPFDKEVVLARRFIEALERCGTAEAIKLREELAKRPAFAPPKPG